MPPGRGPGLHCRPTHASLRCAPLGLASLGQCHQAAGPGSPVALLMPRSAALRSVSLRSVNATRPRARAPLSPYSCLAPLRSARSRFARSMPPGRGPGLHCRPTHASLRCAPLGLASLGHHELGAQGGAALTPPQVAAVYAGGDESCEVTL